MTARVNGPTRRIARHNVEQISPGTVRRRWRFVTLHMNATFGKLNTDFSLTLISSIPRLHTCSVESPATLARSAVSGAGSLSAVRRYNNSSASRWQSSRSFTEKTQFNVQSLTMILPGLNPGSTTRLCRKRCSFSRIRVLVMISIYRGYLIEPYTTHAPSSDLESARRG